MRQTLSIVAFALSIAGAGCAGSKSTRRPETPAVGTTPVKHDRIPLSRRNQIKTREKDVEIYEQMTKAEGGIVH